MNPTLEYSLKSARYMVHTMIPGLTLAYIENHYIMTGDKSVWGHMDSCAERLKLAVGKYHPNGKRVPKLLEEIDEGVKVIKERY